MKKQPQQKERVSRWKGTYFKRNFVFILLIACIPGLLTGGAIYFLSIDKVEKELQRSHETQVAREVSRMDEKLGVLELALTQMAYDSSLMNGLAERDLEKDLYVLLSINEKAVSFAGSAAADRAGFHLSEQPPATCAEP